MKKRISRAVRQYGIVTVLMVAVLFALASMINHTPTPEQLHSAAGKNQGSVTVHVPVYNARYTIQNMDNSEFVIRGAYGSQSFTLPVGNYRVDFQEIFGHQAPSTQTFLIEPESNVQIRGRYNATYPAPLLVMSLYPHNAEYTIYDSTNRVMTQATGSQYFTFEPGAYRIHFHGIEGFKTPRDLNFKMILGNTFNVNVFYGL